MEIIVICVLICIQRLCKKRKISFVKMYAKFVKETSDVLQLLD